MGTTRLPISHSPSIWPASRRHGPRLPLMVNGSFYVVWSGGPNGGIAASGQTNSQGIFFSRSDDGGNNFTPAINIAPPSAVAPPIRRLPSIPRVTTYTSYGNRSISPSHSPPTTHSISSSRTPPIRAPLSPLSPRSPRILRPCVSRRLPFRPRQTPRFADRSRSVWTPAANPDMAWVNQASRRRDCRH